MKSSPSSRRSNVWPTLLAPIGGRQGARGAGRFFRTDERSNEPVPRETGAEPARTPPPGKGLREGLVALVGTGLLASAVNSNADSLNITNSISGNFLSNARIVHSTNPSASDGLDNLDTPKILSGNSYVYAEVEGAPLQADVRPITSRTPFILRTFLNGTLTTNTPNSVLVGYHSGDFGYLENMTLRLLDTSDNLTTNAWDVKASILTNSGVINLPNLPAGTYDFNNPLRSFQIDFDPLVPVTNQPPIASSSTSLGNKADIRNGFFNVSDIDGSVTNVYTLNTPAGFIANGTN